MSAASTAEFVGTATGLIIIVSDGHIVEQQAEVAIR